MTAIEFTTIEVWPKVLTLWMSPYLKLLDFNELLFQGKVKKNEKEKDGIFHPSADER